MNITISMKPAVTALIVTACFGPLGSYPISNLAAAETPKIGDRIDGFTLRDTRGKEQRVAAVDGVKATVLAFNGVGCPIAELYTPRLQRLHEKFGSQGVRFFGMNSNQQDDVAELRGFVNKYQLTFPVLKDHDHAVANRLDAQRTTEVFVLDSTMHLRYRGRIDDQYTITDRSVGIRKDRPEADHLADALTALIEGKTIQTPETEAYGCVIGRKRRIKDATSITYYRDVEPVIQRNCQSCHREGEIGQFPLLEYDDVVGWTGMIREVVENRRMPPWHADAKHGTFANDRSLSRSEIDLIVSWIDNGAPEGDTKDRQPAPQFDQDWIIGKPDVVYEMPETFEVPAEGTIRYQYFKIKTDFEEDRWVQAAEIRAETRAVVHHILVFATDPKNPRRWRRKWRGGKAGYFAAMVPGERPMFYPDGQAKRLPAGSTLIFQVHYTATGKPERDRSRIALVFAKGPVKQEVRTRSAYADWWLVIPPEAPSHPIVTRYTFKKDSLLLSFLPHMHLRGKSFEYLVHYPTTITVSREPNWGQFSADEFKRVKFDPETKSLTWIGEVSDATLEKFRAMYSANGEDLKSVEKLKKDGRSEVLLRVPNYDFGWQNTYRLAEEKLIPRGTMLVCTGQFDNSPSNPVLTRDMWNETVHWGEQTWDEMLIGYFDVIDLK